MLPVFTMRPQPLFSMYGTAALVVWKVEDRQTAMMSSHLSSGKDSTGDTCWMPALLLGALRGLRGRAQAEVRA
jgi:hypothetical protein